MPLNNEGYDAAVVGGGPAGLSAALMLGRARRSVLVVDNGQPRNAPAAHMHGFLSRDGVPPGRLLEEGRREAAGYGGEFADGRALSASREHGGFALELDTGRTVRARRLVVTTGIVDELPDVPGLRERWGRDVLHWPYCDGWEVRDQPVGVLSTGPMSAHQALLFRQWTDRLTLLAHTGPRPTREERERLDARGIAVVDGEVCGLETVGNRLVGVRLSTGGTVPLGALAVAPRARPRAEVLAALGLKPSPDPRGFGERIAADATGSTEAAGVWVAGNIADPAANVLGSAASGAAAAGAVNSDLIAEETDSAVAARNAPFSAESEARLCERVLGEGRHGV
ncbi:NAD(P)/FAD-dependent oxidoreductase [Streptomonospora wellingtoniae]|uniref:NAD(P)/FAD-dependent oxidoreductase n=1 Tax=Streptomonospora wellingtoniae TaxID=3075544 RepID=A0ABU2KQF6_9ACTN|nr:NAD(P)/FAD-dependent oxidoreductase [Streptomonospora sp. DSM 45055]MDT0301358.1 NAD(P)/FAD-dependent oxidoreductase [Streptomonospora sp. DSM 45055]